MSKVYVILARNYEYNDEGYDVTDGGNVVRAYTSHAAAETARVQMTMDRLRDGGMCYLTEKRIAFDDDAYNMLEKHGIQPSDDYLVYYEAEDITEAIKSGQINEDELRILARGIDEESALFFVQEVEVE